MTTPVPILPAPPPRRHLFRVLGLAFGVAVGVGGTIGGGILRTPGSVLDHVPSVWLTLALWAACGLHCLLGANVVAEVMTAVPRTGGLMVASRAAFGRSGGLLVGWTDWLNFVAGIGALSIVCAEYLALVVPKVAGSEGLLGAAIAIFLFALNWAGVRQGSLTQIFTTLAKVVLLSALIGLVFTSPAMRHAATNPRPLSLFGIIVAYQIIYGVYSGWASPAYFAEEHTAPSRNIPRSLVMSLLLITSLYVLINAALIHALPIERLRASNLPAAEAIANLLGPTSIKLVVLVALVTVISCINAGIMTGVRILHGLSQEGLLPSAFSHVNRGGTPDVAMGTTALAAILLALSGQFETVFLAMSALVIFSLAMTDASLFRLRRTAPDLPRPYRARGYPWLPALVLLLDAGLVVAFLARDLRSGAFLLLAVVICVPLGRMKRWSNE